MVRPGALFESLARPQGEVERVHAPDEPLFRRRFRRARRPAVLTGLMDDWPALGRWTFELFRREYGEVEVGIGALFQREHATTLGRYLDGLAGRGPLPASRSGLPLYLEGWYFQDDRPELAQDYSPPPCMGPDWFQRFFPKSLARLTGEILIGPAGAFTKLHVDSHGTPGWLAQLAGRKRWVVAPPDDLAHLFEGRGERAGGYPGLEHPRLATDERVRAARYWTATIGPGEMIYVPGDWFHQVTVLEDSISLTHNFFNANEARRVLYELARSFVRARARRLGGGRGSARP